MQCMSIFGHSEKRSGCVLTLTIFVLVCVSLPWMTIIVLFCVLLFCINVML